MIGGLVTDMNNRGGEGGRGGGGGDKIDTMGVHGNLVIYLRFVYIYSICNFITIQHTLLKCITIAARNP